MHNFVPQSRYTSEQWRKFSESVAGTNKPNCAMDVFAFPFTEDTWFAWGGFESEFCAPASGYLYPFDTVTDLVLWLRWAVCGIASDPWSGLIRFKTRKVIESAIQIIDAAPDGTQSTAVLSKLSDLVYEVISGFTLNRIESVHDYLYEEGNVQEWRTFLGDDSIQENGERWSMSSVGWEELTEKFRDAGFERISAC